MHIMRISYTDEPSFNNKKVLLSMDIKEWANLENHSDLPFKITSYEL